jgi:hypothetical protein
MGKVVEFEQRAISGRRLNAAEITLYASILAIQELGFDKTLVDIVEDLNLIQNRLECWVNKHRRLEPHEPA